MGKENNEVVAVESTARTDKAEKKAKKNGRPNAFVRAGRWIKTKCKEVFSELKKVTWPTFGKVVKQTGVVIAVVAVFLVAISLMDVALTVILNLLVK